MSRLSKHFDNHGFRGELFCGSTNNIRDGLSFYLLDDVRDYQYGWRSNVNSLNHQDKIIIY